MFPSLVNWRGDTETLSLFHQEEDRRRAKEEQERQEEEEYLRLKASFVVEEQGEEDQLTEDQVTPSLVVWRHVYLALSLKWTEIFTFCHYSPAASWWNLYSILRWEPALLNTYVSTTCKIWPIYLKSFKFLHFFSSKIAGNVCTVKRN